VGDKDVVMGVVCLAPSIAATTVSTNMYPPECIKMGLNG
jgi:hypothetical protein